MKTRWNFCKGHLLARFDSLDDAKAWAERNGYKPLGISANCEHPTEEIEYYADMNDLPEGITEIEGNEEAILDYYGLWYEPCLVPEEVE